MKPTFTKRFLNWLKRDLLWISIFIVFLSATGMIYQTAASEADKKNFPPPGNLIDVGGFKMHIYCISEGSPTVILTQCLAAFHPIGVGSSLKWRSRCEFVRMTVLILVGVKMIPNQNRHNAQPRTCIPC